MALQTHLKRRGSTYYARIVVPVDLQEQMGRGELAKSLRTNDPREAKRLLLPVIDGWHREFDALRRRREITEADFADATWEHYITELELDGQERAFASGGSSDWRQHHAKALRRHLGLGETVLIEWAADAYIAKKQLAVKPGTPNYRDLCFRLMRAQIEALERAGERDQGDYAGRPADPAVVRPEAPQTPVAKPGETIAELFEVYAAENPKRITEGTLAQARRDIGTFIDLKGRDFPVGGIDKVAVRDWKALLRRYPVKAAESKVFAGMTFAEIIKANETVGKPVIGDKTVNRYLAAFGAFCHWLVGQGYIDASPVGDMYISVDKHRSDTETFTVDQMNALFASPLFTGCKDDHAWHKPGKHLIRDHRFWIPLVMLYSGCRVGEIAQLLVNDVVEQDGHWLMVITDEGEDQRTKTRGSNRVVPIHSELVKLGFVEFVKRQRAAGGTKLFPEATRNSAGQIAATFSSKFSKHLSKLGMKDGRGLSLYSLRHGVADALRRAGYMDADFGFILGHGAATMTSRYGKLPQGVLARRVELIEAVSYPGLHLATY